MRPYQGKKKKIYQRNLIKEEDGEYSLHDDDPDVYTESDLDDDAFFDKYDTSGTGNFIRL